MRDLLGEDKAEEIKRMKDEGASKGEMMDKVRSWHSRLSIDIDWYRNRTVITTDKKRVAGRGFCGGNGGGRRERERETIVQALCKDSGQVGSVWISPICAVRRFL